MKKQQIIIFLQGTSCSPPRMPSSPSTTTTTMILIVATLLLLFAPHQGSAWVPSTPFLLSGHRCLEKPRPSQPLFVSSALTTTTRHRPAGHAEVVPDSANDFRDDNNVLNYGMSHNAYEDGYNDYLLEEEEELLLEEEERLAEEEELLEEELREEEEILANGGELVPFETEDGEVFVAARGDMIPLEEEERLLEEEMDRVYYYNDGEMSMLYDDEPSPFDRFSSFLGETTNALVSGTMGLLSPLFRTTPFIETVMESNNMANIDVQPLLEEAEDILNDDENCLNFLGDDIEIGPVFSRSTSETSINGNVRQETVLQASVQGSLYEEGEATVEIVAVDGGMIEEMLVQLEDGTEINLPGIAMDEAYYEDEMEEEILAQEEEILAEEEEEIEEAEMRRNQFR